MAYNLRYTSDFKTVRNEIKSYRVDIYEDGYAGSSENILLGSDPVIQEWQDDGYKTPIRGCSVTINIINEGNISMNDFYSDEDNKFKVILTDLSTAQILFQGFVIQDDCQELQVDFAHVISISATDNLGLLKEITLDQAQDLIKTPVTITGITFSGPLLSGGTFLFTDAIVLTTLNPGDVFTIVSGALAGTYTYVSSFVYTAGTYWINVLESVPAGSAYTSDLTTYDSFSFDEVSPLSDIFKVCLKASNLSLNVKVLAQIYPIDGQYNRWIEDVYVNINTFRGSDGFENCYTILEKILDRFSATLFQAYGEWYIIRWGEIWRYSTVDGASFFGYSYDDNLTHIADYTSEKNFDFHNLSDIQTGLLKSINRPIKLATETFNYNQRINLINNANLEEKGDLLATYEDGETRTCEKYTTGGLDGFKINGDVINFVKGQTIRISGSGAANGDYTVVRVYVFSSTQFIVLVEEAVPALSSTSKTITYRQVDEYDVPYWYDYDVNPSPAATRFIRKYSHIGTDVTIDTFIVVTGNTFDQTFAAQSNNIQLSFGDTIKYTFDYRTDISQPGAVNNVFNVRIKNNNNNLYVKNSGNWETTTGFTYSVLAGDNTDQWHTVTIESNPLPYDAILNIFLTEATATTADETHYKNFNLEIVSKLSYQNIIGQTHTDQQFQNLKNINEKEIFLDDCIKPYLNGTLFTKFTINNLRQLTFNWNYVGASLAYSLGHMTTLENVFQNYYAKDIYDGTHLEIANNDGDIMSPASVLKDAQDPELKRYVFGALSLNYREGTADFTMYEVDNSDITMAGFNGKNLYEFKYLYDKQ